MYATVEVIGSSCTWIIGKFIQNPGNTEMHITSAARLRLALHTTTATIRIDRWMNDNTGLMTLPFDDQWTDGTHTRSLNKQTDLHCS